ncbi:hypothetical protein [Nonomuraea zeae]|uniref:Uncharacterized protein n=1 Tax=Nonomuraea zeae TaxID=1642303 RepID=A0A5S4G558_9ACTN|nr:hypothetical protein [Nonomuraea zeae]TMR27551.1 hypothetical protein ETD85_38780 [Nonomuraea zeae]
MNAASPAMDAFSNPAAPWKSAHALAVPLLLLIFPVGDLDRIPTIPLEPAVHPRTAWKTAIGAELPVRSGAEGMPYADRSAIGPDGPTRLEAWRAVARPIELYQQLSDQTDLMIKATGRLTYLERVNQSESREAQHVREVRQHHLNEMAMLRETMVDSGIRVPSYDPQTAQEIIETGLLTCPEAFPSLPASTEDAWPPPLDYSELHCVRSRRPELWALVGAVIQVSAEKPSGLGEAGGGAVGVDQVGEQGDSGGGDVPQRGIGDR